MAILNKCTLMGNNYYLCLIILGKYPRLYHLWVCIQIGCHSVLYVDYAFVVQCLVSFGWLRPTTNEKKFQSKAWLLFSEWVIFIRFLGYVICFTQYSEVQNTSSQTGPKIFNIIRWLAGSMGQTARRPSIWHSKHYIFLS